MKLRAAAALLLMAGNPPALAHGGPIVEDFPRAIAGRDACHVKAMELFNCLLRHESSRATRDVFADGPHPFTVTRHEIVDSGQVGSIAYSFNIAYPQFDAASADFTAVNRFFVARARDGVDTVIPDALRSIGMHENWSYEQAFEIWRPGRNAVSIDLSWNGYTGGAHPYHETAGVLIDLRTGKMVIPVEVYAPGDHWLGVLVPIVREALAKQFEDRPGFEGALEPANVARLLHDFRYYHYRVDGLMLKFDQYVIGSYLSLEYEVEIPYDVLRPLFRADGPLGP